MKNDLLFYDKYVSVLSIFTSNHFISMFRSIIQSVIILAIGALLMLVLLKSSMFNLFKTEDVVTELTTVERVQHIGKLELTKYFIKDVIEYKQKIDFLPDPSVLLVVSGEVIGCIDLEKITPQSITETDSSIAIKLPEPEICVFKINHQESKVYDSKFGFFKEADLVDKAYKQAEVGIKATAEKQGIIKDTKERANYFVRNFLQQFTHKKIQVN